MIIALLCLLFSDLNSNKALGPVAAAGILCALFAALTLLPALLALLGRGAFWPFLPRLVPEGEREPRLVTGLEGQKGLWRATGSLVSRRPRTVWVASVLLLLAASAGILQLKANGVPQTDVILSASNAVDGQDALARHFDAGSGSPAVIVATEAKAAEVLAEVKASDGVGSAYLLADGGVPVVSSEPAAPGAPTAPAVRDGRVLINATLDFAADSNDAENAVLGLRESVKGVDPEALVGGVTATALDTNTTAQRDLVTIIPVVLAVILAILMLLLRSVLAPVLLVASVVLSYAAAMGVSAFVFNTVLGFPGADATVPLFGFVFLVALGVDYNIFLMSRVREESLKHGTRPGILRGLGVTGGVITSAGVVLAATFAALGVIPIMFLVQLAFIVAFGVLLDTVLVRSLLVPALAYDLGRRIWWPSRLGRAEPQPFPAGGTKRAGGTRGPGSPRQLAAGSRRPVARRILDAARGGLRLPPLNSQPGSGAPAESGAGPVPPRWLPSSSRTAAGTGRASLRSRGRRPRTPRRRAAASPAGRRPSAAARPAASANATASCRCVGAGLVGACSTRFHNEGVCAALIIAAARSGHERE